MKYRIHILFSILSILYCVVFLSSCQSSAGNKILIPTSLSEQSPKTSQLIKRIKSYYSYLEAKEWESIYDLLSERLLTEHKEAMQKSEIIDYLENDTGWGKQKWKFTSLEMKALILKETRAYVEMEYSIQVIDTFEHKYINGPNETWWDEWVFEEDNWKLYSFFRSGYRPKDWPKD